MSNKKANLIAIIITIIIAILSLLIIPSVSHAQSFHAPGMMQVDKQSAEWHGEPKKRKFTIIHRIKQKIFYAKKRRINK